MLCAAVLATVVGFGSSSRLAGAYGVAVTGTMLVDTLLTFFVSATSGAIRCGCACRHRLFPGDLMFFSATLLKIADGGWFPLVIGGGMFLVL